MTTYHVSVACIDGSGQCTARTWSLNEREAKFVIGLLGKPDEEHVLGAEHAAALTEQLQQRAVTL